MLEEVTMTVPASTAEKTIAVDTSILDKDEKEEKSINSIKNSSEVFDDLPKSKNFATKHEGPFGFMMMVVCYIVLIVYII